MTKSEFISNLAEAVDRRRQEITLVQRVVSSHTAGILEQTAAIMALPLLYAHWEGFVKEAVETYLEFIESQQLQPASANPIVFSFAIKRQLKHIVASGSPERIAEFATWMIAASNQPLTFEEKSVDTRSNLSFENLKSLCDTLRINVRRIESEKRQINKLVHRRNNIAHTGRPLRVSEENVNEDAKLVLRLIETFEMILAECVEADMFLA